MAVRFGPKLSWFDMVWSKNIVEISFSSCSYINIPLTVMVKSGVVTVTSKRKKACNVVKIFIETDGEKLKIRRNFKQYQTYFILYFLIWQVLFKNTLFLFLGFTLTSTADFNTLTALLTLPRLLGVDSRAPSSLRFTAASLLSLLLSLWSSCCGLHKLR